MFWLLFILYLNLSPFCGSNECFLDCCWTHLFFSSMLMQVTFIFTQCLLNHNAGKSLSCKWANLIMKLSLLSLCGLQMCVCMPKHRNTHLSVWIYFHWVIIKNWFFIHIDTLLPIWFKMLNWLFEYAVESWRFCHGHMTIPSWRSSDLLLHMLWFTAAH